MKEVKKVNRQISMAYTTNWREIGTSLALRVLSNTKKELNLSSNKFGTIQGTSIINLDLKITGAIFYVKSIFSRFYKKEFSNPGSFQVFQES